MVAFLIELLGRIKRAGRCLRGLNPEPVKTPRQPLWVLSSISRWFLALTLLGIGITAWHIFDDPHTDSSVRLMFTLLAALFVTERLQSYFGARVEEISLENMRLEVEGIREDLDKKNTQMTTTITGTFDQMTTTITRTFEMKTIGSHTQAFHYVVERLHAAHRMKDTFFRSEEDQILIGHSFDTKRYMDACLELLQRGGSFEFILSKVNREVALRVNAEIIDYIMQYDMLGRWQAFELDHGGTPIINMIILSYDDYREVLFGWNYSNTDDGLVFSSTNPRVVQYFDALFDRTRSCAKRLYRQDLSPARCNGPADAGTHAASAQDNVAAE